MPQLLTDYSNNIRLKLFHQLMRSRRLRITLLWRIIRKLSGLIPLPKPAGPCLVRTLHGFVILVDPTIDKGVEKSIFNFGTYEEGTLNILENILVNKSSFVDIGANIGLMSLHAANILNGKGRVISFEPLPGTYNILQHNIKINNFNNIDAANLALGSENGTVEIFENLKINRGSSSLIKPDETESGYKIEIKRLDDYLAENNIDHKVDCLKIDVEGWELEVLKGASSLLSKPDAPVCIIECSNLHPTHGGVSEDIFTFLRSVNSYRIFRLAGGKDNPSKLIEIKSIDELPEHDNLFCFLQHDINALPEKIFN